MLESEIRFLSYSMDNVGLLPCWNLSLANLISMDNIGLWTFGFIGCSKNNFYGWDHIYNSYIHAIHLYKCFNNIYNIYTYIQYIYINYTNVNKTLQLTGRHWRRRTTRITRWGKVGVELLRSVGDIFDKTPLVQRLYMGKIALDVYFSKILSLFCNFDSCFQALFVLVWLF